MLARDRHRHDVARQHGLRVRDQHGRELGHHHWSRQPWRPDGSFSIDVPVTGGTSVLNVVAVSPTGATAHVQRTILFDFVPGTLILEVTDPDFDDNGPGNYAYPTSGDFHAGAFDIQAFQVYDAGSEVIFRIRTRDLSETFGSPLGAQLVDIYVHDPAAAAGIDLDERLERIAQLPDRPVGSVEPADPGPGLRSALRGRDGATLGTVSISGNAISRYITVRVPKATLGQPVSGWGFTVVLHGQDGFSPDGDQARGFQPIAGSRSSSACAPRPASMRPLHGGLQLGPEADGRDHARRRLPGRRGRLHAARARRARPGSSSR